MAKFEKRSTIQPVAPPAEAPVVDEVQSLVSAGDVSPPASAPAPAVSERESLTARLHEQNEKLLAMRAANKARNAEFAAAESEQYSAVRRIERAIRDLR